MKQRMLGVVLIVGGVALGLSSFLVGAIIRELYVHVLTSCLGWEPPTPTTDQYWNSTAAGSNFAGLAAGLACFAGGWAVAMLGWEKSAGGWEVPPQAGKG